MKPNFSILITWVLIPTCAIFGQKPDTDSDYGIFQTQAEYNQFMGTVKAAGRDDPGIAAMVPLVNDIVRGQEIGTTDRQYGLHQSNLGLLADPEVRADLEMVNDQYTELQQRNTAIQKRAAEQLRLLDFSNRDDLLTQIRKIRAQSEADMRAALLPHQIERLSQIAAQSQLRRRSLVDVITAEPLKSDLKISDTQAQDLKAAEEEIESELAREIEQLRQRARAKLISTLDLEQKSKVEKLFGDVFSFRQPKKTRASKSKGK